MDELIKKINQLSTQLDKLEEKLADVEKKLDAIIYFDEDVQEYLSGNLEITDELVAEALEVMIEYQRVSPSLLQRRLSIGYMKATQLLEYFEQEGITSSSSISGVRTVLITNPKEYWEKRRRN